MPYAAPRTLDEALVLLTQHEGARVLAGGHALLVEPRRSRLARSLLVDLHHVPGLAGLRRGPEGLRIGAMTRLAEVADDPAVRSSYPVLAEAIERTGDPQLRNRATIGGGLATSSADNDLRAVVAVLGGELEIAGSGGTRQLGADELLGGNAALANGEILTALLLPEPAPRSGAAYHAHRNPATLTPVCGAAVAVTLDPGGTVTAGRVVIVGAGGRPGRSHAVEQKLAGTRPAAAIAAADAAAEGLAWQDDLFASADYRRHLARVLTARALQQALQRAGG